MKTLPPDLLAQVVVDSARRAREGICGGQGQWLGPADLPLDSLLAINDFFLAMINQTWAAVHSILESGGLRADLCRRAAESVVEAVDAYQEFSAAAEADLEIRLSNLPRSWPLPPVWPHRPSKHPVLTPGQIKAQAGLLLEQLNAAAPSPDPALLQAAREEAARGEDEDLNDFLARLQAEALP